MFLAALFGASFQELAWWYELRRDLDARKYRSLMRSKKYWIVSIAMIVAAATGTLVLNYPRLLNYSPGDFMIFGAAFPLVFKHLTSVVGRKETTLGGDEVSLSAYFTKT
jgi:hypothetical protein